MIETEKISFVKKITRTTKIIIVGFFDLFPWLHFLFYRLIPPEIRWSKAAIQEKIKKGKEQDKYFLRFFLRDPKRRVPVEKNIIVAPADGVIKRIFDEDGKKVILIHLDFFDVHVQRVPISGKVVSVEEAGHKVEKGSEEEKRYFENSLLYDKDYLFPIQNVTKIDADIGRIVVRQIATIFARRIVTSVKAGEEVKIGQKLGMIYLGSYVAIELPKQVRIIVEEKKRIYGGETIIARY